MLGKKKIFQTNAMYDLLEAAIIDKCDSLME